MRIPRLREKGHFLKGQPCERIVDKPYLGITSRLLVIREKSRKGQKTRPSYHLIIYMKHLPETVGTRAGADVEA